MYLEHEKYYREVEWPKVLESIKEWQQEEDMVAARKEYLLQAIKDTREDFFKVCKELAGRSDDLTHWSEKEAETLERRLFSLEMRLKVLTGREVGISPELIAQARLTPIERVIKVQRGMAACPFHKDRHPSMDVRKNFYYCYSCGETGDVIDLVQKTQGLSFKQAIDFLT